MKSLFRHTLLVSLLLIACGCSRLGADTPDAEETPTPSPTATATPGPDGDAATFQQILDGTLGAAEGLALIEMSAGWPIHADGGVIFARIDDGRGPYSLTGDHNDWNLDRMSAEGGLWWVQVPVPSPQNSKYKFVTATQAYEADPLARRYGYDEFGEFSLVRGANGHLERYRGLVDSSVNDRVVRVWVPASAPTHHLYLHDGQNLFNPAGPFGSWRLQESLGAATLAIGVDNTVDRADEYTHVADVFNGQNVGGGGDAYVDYVENVVRPFVESRYGTPTAVGVMGSSLGGLVSFHQADRHDGRYDFAASLSGTFRWGSFNASNETMLERYIGAGHRSTTLYLDSGGSAGTGCVDADGDGLQDDGDDSDSYCENRQFADELFAVGYVFDQDLHHWYEADAPHNEAAWAARVWRPIQIFESL